MAAYLLLIDEKPASDSMQNYFAEHNIAIVQQQRVYPIPAGRGLPLAIILHWNRVKKHPNLISKLYRSYATPLILVNDEADEEACVLALESGADEFLITPFSPDVLHARIKSILKPKIPLAQAKEVLSFGPWRLLPVSRQVIAADDKELTLSAGEYDLLYAFVQQPQTLLTRDDLLKFTQNEDLSLFDRRIDLQISRLRKKIEPDAKNPTFIQTVRNKGYIFSIAVSRSLLS
jgi:two-component system OmpR family response regulator